MNPLHSVEIDIGGENRDERFTRLIKSIARADEVAFKQFYDATMPRVYGLALTITQAPDIAEDVVIDVYLQVWRNAERYDPARGRPFTWLLTMCRSRAIDAVSAHASIPPQWALPAACTTREEEPEHLLAVLEQKSAIAEALRQLSAAQRRLIGLSFFRGLSHGEIAAAVDMPLGTVKTHIRKGLKALELLLADSQSVER